MNFYSLNIKAKAGFSLIEISIALMVVAVGMLGVLTMFPVGLEQNQRSIEDTYAAMAAQEVFASLSMYAENNWENLSSFTFPVAASDMWTTPNIWRFTSPNTILTNKYSYQNIEDHAFRYRLIITTNGYIKQVTLLIYPGEFGSINKPPLVFYNEFYKMR